MEDIYLVCRQIKATSQFGKLNINKVLAALNKHIDTKANTAAERSYNQHLSTKHVDNTREGKKEVEQAKFKEAQLWYLKEYEPLPELTQQPKKEK